MNHTPKTNGKPRICFVAHNAYGALAGHENSHIGGIEWQQTMMARWLASRGCHVTVITWDQGQDDNVTIDGVRVVKMCAADAGMKGLRFLHPKWTSLSRAMTRADSDIYYYNCGDLGLGQVAMWCRRHGRKCVYSVGSDPACDPSLPALKPQRERLLYSYGLKRADSIIVQTQRQQRMLREGFGLDSTVIPMPCQSLDNNGEAPTETPTPHVLWIGRISPEKRFEWLLDIAERCPHITFDVVGASNSDDDPYAAALYKRSSEMANVNMHGKVLHSDIGRYFRRARALCSTSAFEGFPNIFLEAWSLGIPVVATCDPDGIISKRGLGFTGANLEQLIAGLNRLIRRPDIHRRASAAARNYYRRNHDPKMCLPKFERHFIELMQNQLPQALTAVQA